MEDYPWLWRRRPDLKPILFLYREVQLVVWGGRPQLSVLRSSTGFHLPSDISETGLGLRPRTAEGGCPHTNQPRSNYFTTSTICASASVQAVAPSWVSFLAASSQCRYVMLLSPFS